MLPNAHNARKEPRIKKETASSSQPANKVQRAKDIMARQHTSLVVETPLNFSQLKNR